MSLLIKHFYRFKGLSCARPSPLLLPAVRAQNGGDSARALPYSSWLADSKEKRFISCGSLAEVCCGGRPLPLLDDAVVHVGDIQGAIRRIADIHRTEQLIGAGHELGSRIGIPQLGQPFDVLDLRPANEAADRLGEQQVPLADPPAADRRGRSQDPRSR